MRKRINIQRASVSTLLIVGTLFIVIFVLTVYVKLPVIDTTRSNAASSPTSLPTQSPKSLERAEKKLLKGVPDFPIYPGAQILHSYIKHEKNLVGYEAEWQASDTVSNITSWYVNSLTTAGWTVTRIPELLAKITPPGPVDEIEFMVTAVKNNTTVNLIIENEQDLTISHIHAEFPLRKP